MAVSSLVKSSAQPPEPDFGTPGASARREGERRRANREQRTRDKHPHIGGLLLALKDAPPHEQVWARGAGGEERIAKLLAKHLNPAALVLHDRAIPRSRANIDHIAIAGSGVWVIDTKRYNGKVAVLRPLFGKPTLTIAGRDQSKLVDGLARQITLVAEVMATVAPAVPVHGALCFTESELPMFGTLTFRGFPLLHAKPLAKRINAAGPVMAHDVTRVAAELATRFPSA